MKKLFFCLFACILISSANAQSAKSKKRVSDAYYCLTVKGDVQLLVQNGKEVTEDIKLKSGDRLSIEGRRRKTDGTEIKLKEGECVNQNGDVIKPN
ncbi:MAG: hypothetical protein H0W73_13340 [Bacteroidetes bacterium]|nr:hypothetical protein [Bacteroidota bacterium]